MKLKKYIEDSPAFKINVKGGVFNFNFRQQKTHEHVGRELKNKLWEGCCHCLTQMEVIPKKTFVEAFVSNMLQNV